MKLDLNSHQTKAERDLWKAQRDEPYRLAAVQVGPPHAEGGASWGEDRVVRGSLLRQILLGQGPSPAPSILRLTGARITEELDLEAASLVCPLHLVGCYFEAAVNLEQARASGIYLFHCDIPDGISADQLHTEHSFKLSNSVIKGGIVLTAARIGGQLVMESATVSSGASGAVLNCRGITIEQGVNLGDVEIEGLLDISGAHIGNNLNMPGARLTKPVNGVSLQAHRLRVNGNLNLNEAFTAEGMVDLTGSRVKGHLGLSNGHFRKGGGEATKETALNLARIVVDQDAYLNSGFTAAGTVSMPDARIGGSLRCEGGVFDNEADTAIYAAGIDVGRDVYLSKKSAEPIDDHSGFLAKGKVVLVDAKVGGTLNFSGGIFRASEESLIATGLHAGSVMFGNAFQAAGKVDLRRVKVDGELKAGRSLRPDQARLKGLSYVSFTDDMKLEERLTWLRKMSTHIPQTYRQLANVKQGEGLDSDARKILVAGKDDFYSKRPWFIKPFGWFFKWTVGYGYSPLWIVAWLAIFELAGGILFSHLRHDILLAPIYINPANNLPQGSITGSATTTLQGYPAFEPWLYTLDLLLPVVRLRQSETWVPHSAAEWCSMVFVIAGWALATSLVVGLGSVFSRGRQNSSAAGF